MKTTHVMLSSNYFSVAFLFISLGPDSLMPSTLNQLLHVSCVFRLGGITRSYDVQLTRAVSDSLLHLLFRFRNFIQQ